MSDVFVDTSAIYAILVADDPAHADAKAALDELERTDATLLTSSAVLYESAALLQRRAGVDAVRRFRERIEPALEVRWVDRPMYDAAMAALLTAGAKDVSLVDWTSFAMMRASACRKAFAFDDDFTRQGFEVIPAPRTARGRADR